MDNNNYEQPQYYQPEPTWNNDAPSENGKGLAIASLVTGIFGLLCCGPSAVAALITAIIARNKGNRSGMSMAGLIMGIIGTLIWVASLIYAAINPDYLSNLTDFMS